jgi:hypothetical protein
MASFDDTEARNVKAKARFSDKAQEAVDRFLGETCKKAKSVEQIAAAKAVAEAIRGIGDTRVGQHDVVCKFLDYAAGPGFHLRAMFEEP